MISKQRHAVEIFKNANFLKKSFWRWAKWQNCAMQKDPEINHRLEKNIYF